MKKEKLEPEMMPIPCPFCGGHDLQNYSTIGSHEPIIEDCGTSWCFTCNDCGGGIGEGMDYTKEQCVRAWNRRTP